jgi:basic amino acid/polyamine antiporter, APA family
MSFVRAIGRWTMTALVVNCIIGSGIFGLPSEVTHLVGRASPIAMIVAGLAMAVIMICIAEVASHFDAAGGPYLYTRTAFGRFAGLQVAWFSILAAIGGGAANASLFMIYLSGFFPWVGHGWQRVICVTVLISIPTIANYFGVRSGAALANVLTIAKLLPLALLIVLGFIRFRSHFELLRASEITSPGIEPWLHVLLKVQALWEESRRDQIPVPVLDRAWGLTGAQAKVA